MTSKNLLYGYALHIVCKIRIIFIVLINYERFYDNNTIFSTVLSQFLSLILL